MKSRREMIKTRRLFENGGLRIWEGEIEEKERKPKEQRKVHL